MTKPTNLDVATAAAWAARAHLYVLDAMMSESRWTCRDIAFHGGTSLHLSWQSPRRSEDLDFLVSRDVADLSAVMVAVERRVRERFLVDDPAMVVEVTDRTKDAERMPNYMVSVSNPARIGKVKVKVEFWRVDADYLRDYPIEFRTPMAPGDMVSVVLSPVPAAQRITAYADKLTAFATRPYLKWRDVFDLWWIGVQSNEALPVGRVATQFLHNVSAYSTRDGNSPADALRTFLERSDEEILASAERDLRPWLPDHLWRTLWPGTVADMVAYCRNSLGIVADYVDANVVPKDDAVLKSVPR